MSRGWGKRQQRICIAKATLAGWRFRPLQHLTHGCELRYPSGDPVGYFPSIADAARHAVLVMENNPAPRWQGAPDAALPRR